MQLVFFDDYRLGVVRGPNVHDASAALADPMRTSPQEQVVRLISGFPALGEEIERAAEGGEVRPLAGLRLRAPLPRPGKILCAAGNYREHGSLKSTPIEFFLKSPEAVLDPDGTVVLPDVPAQVFQHEAELAVVIGKTASGVPAEEALGYVFGYTIFCDVSCRGFEPINYFTGKSFDTFAPLGPALVTADEVPDPQRLRVALDVNDYKRQRYGTDDMANRVADLIAFASKVTTLRTGDVIATGTNHQELSAIQDGDRLVLRIEDWPELRFGVRDPQKRSWGREIDEAIAAEARAGR